jgi:DNA repair exonuclease SbcCD nuclease subunit
VPLIVAGDLHDTKAMMRGEVVAQMIQTFKMFQHMGGKAYVLVGNHDKINERSPLHSLEFLRTHVQIVDESYWGEFEAYSMEGLWLLPYYSDLDALQATLQCIPKGATIIMHQGLTNASGGHYMHDNTAAPPEWFGDFRVISGHYHKAQDIECGRPRKGAVGLFSYVGSPYTMNFGEANDGPKGFRVLMDDGSLEFVPTNLRRHVVEELTLTSVGLMPPLPVDKVNPGDLLWLKIKGNRSDLEQYSKEAIGNRLKVGSDYKLDLIPIDSHTEIEEEEKAKMTDLEVLKKLIDGLPDDAEYHQLLKDLVDGMVAE